MNHKDVLFNLPEHIEHDNKPVFLKVKPRLKIAVRNQVEILSCAIDDQVPDEHKVRNVWNYVEQLDLSKILGKIKSVESSPGAPAIDPRILMALWLYAFIEGIISAKTINRYCIEHIAFRWLCGGVSVNEHTISDFRTDNGEAFDDLLTQSIGVLSHQGLITIGRIAQDGMKVEAHAGKSSFRREKTLKKHLKIAEAYVKTLKKEFVENPGALSLRQAAAKKRAAEVRVKKTKQALEELELLRNQKKKACKRNGKSFTEKDKSEVRASKTDPEILADPGFLEYNDVDKVSQTSSVYIPCETVMKDHSRKSIREMKERMEMHEAKEIYKQRASTAEFVNARVRTRGFTQVLVTGLAKVQVVATLFAIGQNMLVWMSKQ